MALSEQEIMKLISTLQLDTSIGALDKPPDPEAQVDIDCIQIEGDRIVVDPAITSPVFFEPVPPVQLLVNGTDKIGRVTVVPGDVVQWKAPAPAMFHLEVAPDRMSAWFRLTSMEQHAMKLAVTHTDLQTFRLEAERDLDRVERKLKMLDIQSALHDIKLFKYDGDKIAEELNNPTYEKILIAEGIRPVPTVDGSLEILFNECVESHFEEVNGQIDFRNHLRIPSAKSGDVVARKIPAVKGTRGYDIFGEVIEPAAPKDMILIPKQHIRLTPAGEAVALKEGRPRITGERVKFISINPSYVVSNDVDLKTGNIFFTGDVFVYGNVTDGMTIEALGNVYISGGVYNATITATGSILVKGNVIGGKLYSGHFGVLYNRLFNYSKKLNEQLQNLRNAAKLLLNALEAQGKSVPIAQALQLLCETKFKEIPSTAKEILSSIVTIQNIQKEHMEDLKQKLLSLLSPACFLKLDPIPFLNGIQQHLIETTESIQRCEETDVALDIPKCQLSTLMSNGDILIRQEGVVQSNLYAKENIVFYSKHAVCRGSSLESGKTISAMTVGGTSGGACTLKAGAKVMVTKMYDGRVFIGGYSKEIIESLENVKFSVRDQRLTIESIPT
ncbi:MAG TPA: FapA family protein [Paenibacillus sp.]|nr:FapA family protein [Paenibacillus sp.]